MLYENEHPDWGRIEGLVLDNLLRRPDWKERYLRSTKSGLLWAKRSVSAYLAGSGRYIPDLRTIIDAHRFAFQGVYRFAGSFFDDNYERRVKLLLRATSELMPRPRTSHEVAQVVAFFHAKMKAISPFEDGTERVARAIAAAQIDLFLDHSLRPSFERSDYRITLEHAITEGNLAPLCLTLTGLVLPRTLREISIPVPKLLANDVPRAYIMCPDLYSMDGVEKARVSEPLAAYARANGVRNLPVILSEQEGEFELRLDEGHTHVQGRRTDLSTSNKIQHDR